MTPRRLCSTKGTVVPMGTADVCRRMEVNNIMSVEFVVRLRDGAQMIADACEEYLEKQVPTNVKTNPEDFEKLSWTEKEGTKSPYEQTTKEANQNSEVFQALQQILSDHKGFWQGPTHKYWNHQDNEDIIDRRKK